MELRIESFGMRLVLRVKSLSKEGLLHEGKLKTERKVCLHMILQTADRVSLLLSFRGSGHRVPGFACCKYSLAVVEDMWGRR